MSLFNQITYLALVGEIAVFLALLVPLTFVPVSARKAAMEFGARAFKLDAVAWTGRVVLLAIGGVFVDTIVRLHKLDSDLHRGQDHAHYDSPLHEMQYKSKLFYSQRNMYLSLMSLVMAVVLYRRVKDLYLILVLQDNEAAQKSTITALKAQVEDLAAIAAATSSTDVSKEEVIASVTEAEIVATTQADAADVEGLRRRV
ncbi:B-cell receptor-associated protein 31-like-domain-containing protein [Chytriomyces sp. MP71]|nr:B-cell receptor-associated protein 31-like-domain-containing protein [Chytriomyces sp. MP71]